MHEPNAQLQELLELAERLEGRPDGGPPWAVPDGWDVAWRVEGAFYEEPQKIWGWLVGRLACAPDGAPPTTPICCQRIGVRLDNHETVWALAPCPAHRQEAALVVDALTTMPGQETEIVTLAADLLDQAIENG